jgi:peroxiredoxin
MTQQSGTLPLLERPLVRAAIALVLLIVIGGGVLWLQRSDGDGSGGVVSIDDRPASSTTPVADPDTGPLDDRAPIIGQPAPDFELRALDGNVVKVSDLRGNVVWINFWASWCRPCRQELPDIQALYDEKRHGGLVVLAVNYEDSADVAREYASDLGMTMPVLLDSGGDVYDQYRLQGLPDSFFIDREGNLATLHFGFLNEDKMRQRLEAAGLP